MGVFIRVEFFSDRHIQQEFAQVPGIGDAAALDLTKTFCYYIEHGQDFAHMLMNEPDQLLTDTAGILEATFSALVAQGHENNLRPPTRRQVRALREWWVAELETDQKMASRSTYLDR
jgi:hypothetical protein